MEARNVLPLVVLLRFGHEHPSGPVTTALKPVLADAFVVVSITSPKTFWATNTEVIYTSEQNGNSAWRLT